MKSMSVARIFLSSLSHRRARSLSAFIALTVSATVATALFTLYADLDAKLHHTFRSFGANVILTPANAPALPPDALFRARQAAGPAAIATPFAYAVATTDRGTQVVAVGTDFSQLPRIDSWWQVAKWPSSADANAVLLGQKAANFIADERNVTLDFGGKSIHLNGAGRFHTGASEDDRVYLPLTTFTAWTGAQPSVIEVQVPGGEAQVDSAISRLRSSFGGEVKVDPVRQLVEGESRIIDRTHALIYASMLLISLTVGVAVLATLSSSVLERRRDFALMKALGASQRWLMFLFLFEAASIALAGVAAGYLLGSATAALIGRIDFQTATLPRISVLPAVLLLNLVIAVLAALLPIRLLRGLQPAALLKGE
ncbi:MAG: ABC transporter permease [Acidobacteriaceae bacterium]